jgi:Na+/H+ antiporter NhaC
MQDSGITGEDASMLSEYIKVIPFMFYPMIIILVSLLLALGLLPRVGAFKRYYNELRDGSCSLSNSATASTDDTEDIFEGNPEDAKLVDFILPVLLLVGVMLLTSDLVVSVILALAAAFALYIPRRKMSVTRYFEHFFSGINDMIYILIVVLMTFVFVRGLNAIGFSEYVIEMVAPVLSGGAIPALTFVTVGVIAFLGVDYWAVMLLIAPVAIPLSGQFGVSEYLTVGAIVSGSVFGGTACFFAEQILMCSQAVQRPPLRVALGGLPYSVLSFVLAAVLYLAAGFSL